MNERTNARNNNNEQRKGNFGLWTHVLPSSHTVPSVFPLFLFSFSLALALLPHTHTRTPHTTPHFLQQLCNAPTRLLRDYGNKQVLEEVGPQLAPPRRCPGLALRGILRTQHHPVDQPRDQGPLLQSTLQSTEYMHIPPPPPPLLRWDSPLLPSLFLCYFDLQLIIFSFFFF